LVRRAAGRVGGVGLAALAIVWAAPSVRAEFEGEMDMAITASGETNAAGSTMRIAVAKAGTRLEVNARMPDMTVKTVVLVREDTPDKVYQIDDSRQTYSVMDVADIRKMAAEHADPDPWSVTKLGEETILGYKTQHVRVTHGQTAMEMWNARDLMDYETYSRMQARQPGAEGLYKALKDAGADGVPLRSRVTGQKGVTVNMEVVRIEKKQLAASVFEIPAGYTETQGGMMGGMSGPKADELRKRMQEAMKDMSPAQREAMQKAMKGMPPAQGQATQKPVYAP
jgi:hypothetical protein